MGICKSIPEQVRAAIRNDSIGDMDKLVNQYPELLSRFAHEYHGNLITFAIKHNATPKMIYMLLGAGTTFETADVHDSIIHAAVLHRDPAVLKIVLAALPKEYINVRLPGNNTVFMSLMKSLPYTYNADELYSQHMDILLKYAKETNNIDINVPDETNNTPILFAASRGYKKMVETIMNYENIDIDSHYYKGVNARWWMAAHSLDARWAPEYIRTFDGCELFAALREQDEYKFLDLLAKRSCDVDVEDGPTLLQLACKHNLVNAVGALIDAHADINKTTIHEPRAPIEIATKFGYYNIVKYLVMPRPHKHYEIRFPPLLMHLALSYYDEEDDKTADVSRRDTLDILLEALRHQYICINWSEEDSHGRTAFECARYWEHSSEVVEKLIKLGANTKRRFNRLWLYLNAPTLARIVDSTLGALGIE
jgi:ankyrin repeat protein